MRKIIYMDISSVLEQPFVTGIQRVVREYAKELISSAECKDVWPVFLMRENKESFRRFFIVDEYKLKDWLYNGKTQDAEYLITSQKIGIDEFDNNSVFFDFDSNWQNRANIYPRLKKRGIKIAPFIHDIIAIEKPYFCSGVHKDLMSFVDASLAYADCIFVSTIATKQKLEKLASDLQYQNVEYYTEMFGTSFSEPTKENEPTPLVKDVIGSGKYILSVGTIEARKNHQLMFDAYEKYLAKETDVNLVFVGRKGWLVDELINKMHSNSDYGKRIWQLEGIDDSDLSHLYRNAFIIGFTTFDEGYGLPAVEALVNGKPIICSDIPVLHEVAGEYAEYCNPNNAREFSEIIKKYIGDEDAYKVWESRISEYRAKTWAEFEKGVTNHLISM